MRQVEGGVSWPARAWASTGPWIRLISFGLGVGWGVQGVWFLCFMAKCASQPFLLASSFQKGILLGVLTGGSDNGRMFFPGSVGVLNVQCRELAESLVPIGWGMDFPTSLASVTNSGEGGLLSWKKLLQKSWQCFENMVLPF